jgi:hypothetical protein
MKNRSAGRLFCQPVAFHNAIKSTTHLVLSIIIALIPAFGKNGAISNINNKDMFVKATIACTIQMAVPA